MPSLPALKEQFELQTFGCTISDINREVARATSPEVVAVNLISAAEEKMYAHCVDEAGQMINRAKYILSEFCSQRSTSQAACMKSTIKQ